MFVYFGRKPLSFDRIVIDNKTIETVDNCKLLGVILNKKLTWDDHIEYTVRKASRRIYFIRLLKRSGVSDENIIKVYTSTIRAVLEYAAEVWHPGLTRSLKHQLEHIQKRVLNIVYPTLT